VDDMVVMLKPIQANNEQWQSFN